MTTLYRKYRPHSFADCVDQEHIIQTIENEIKKNSLAHAYLFSGPRGVGKTTLARLLAKAVNCEKRKPGTSEPCDTCSNCIEVNNGRHIDVIEIDAASQTGIDNVRDNIIENARFKPTKAPFKVFIIDEVHMLSNGAFNALLKTLEEPPTHVIFILATTELHDLPATVISRCERFQFKKISFDAMQGRLEKLCAEEGAEVSAEILNRVIHKSDGCLRDAESLLGQLLSINNKKITLEEASLILPTSQSEQVLTYLEKLGNNETKEALLFLNILVTEGYNLEQFALDLIDLLRVLMIASATKNFATVSANYSAADLKRLEALIKLFPYEKITSLIDLALKRRLEIKSAPIPQLPLELFTIETTIASSNNLAPTLTVPEQKISAIKNVIAEQPTAPKQPHQSLANTIKEVLHISHPLKTTLEDIKNKWPAVITAVDESAHSLTFILNMCSLERITGDTLELTVPYSLHKDKLVESKNKKILEAIMEKILGEKIYLSCQVLESVVTVPEPTTDLQTLAAAFGGEVVN